jgi:hypothetical protein
MRPRQISPSSPNHCTTQKRRGTATMRLIGPRSATVGAERGVVSVKQKGEAHPGDRRDQPQPRPHPDRGRTPVSGHEAVVGLHEGLVAGIGDEHGSRLSAWCAHQPVAAAAPPGGGGHIVSARTPTRAARGRKREALAPGGRRSESHGNPQSARWLPSQSFLRGIQQRYAADVRLLMQA